MINATIYKDNQNLSYGYTVEGHANYDMYGKDIVCAAVSALVQTVLVTLDEICRITYKVVQNRGFVEVIVFNEDIALKEVQALFKALEIGIEAIEDEYPEYVKLEIINKTP